MYSTIKNLYPGLIIIFSLIAFCCKKTDKREPVPPTPPLVTPSPVPFVDVKVTASLQGRVVDENDKPVGNALVKAGLNSFMTDTNGFFTFNNIQIGKKAAYVSAEKEGFFKNGRTFNANEATVNYTEIRLLLNTNSNTFSSGTGGTVNIENGNSIAFAANSIVDATTGLPFSGVVTVKNKCLDPINNANFSSLIPGNLMGLDSLSQLKMINPVGIAAIELENSSGQKLNIMPGKQASITLAIPSAMLAKAPAKISLWYFNDTIGLWKKQGYAMKEGNNYVGEISHFTYWTGDIGNIDDPGKPLEFVALKMKFKDQGDNPLQYYKAVFSGFPLPYIFSDSTGFISLTVPKDFSLQLKIFNKCGDNIFSKDIGPFTTDTDLGTFQVNIPESGNITLSGIVLNCNQDTIIGGAVNVVLEGVRYTSRINRGHFSINIDRCYSTASIAKLIAIDSITGLQSDEISINITTGNYKMDNLIVECPIDEYLNLKINDSTSYNLKSPSYQFIGSYQIGNSPTEGSTTLDAVHDDSWRDLPYVSAFFWFGGGKITGMKQLSGAIFLIDGFDDYYVNSSTIPIQITEYGPNVGDYVKGNFSGFLIDSLTHTKQMKVDCNFKIRIQYQF